MAARTTDFTELTATSYAILGLLAIKPWSTYELAKQIERGMRNFWPRAQSTVYLEPKRLVAHGLAKAKRGQTGRRPRTMYSITPMGRRALAAWLSEPGEAPQLEFEGALKAFFAEHGDRASLMRTLAAAAAWAQADLVKGRGIAQGYVDGTVVWPGRMHVNSIMYPLLWDFATLVARWARWAEEQASGWPEDATDGPIRMDLYREAASSKPGEEVPLL